MAKNRRKTYEESIGLQDPAEGIPCAECGCRHSYVIRTERIGELVRRTRECRNCGNRFYTTEAV